eukprot:3941727-Rhodomonas_salina.5
MHQERGFLHLSLQCSTLRLSYAMSGTDTGATRYAMSSTGPTPYPVLAGATSYAVTGTNSGYDATRLAERGEARCLPRGLYRLAPVYEDSATVAKFLLFWGAELSFMEVLLLFILAS